MIRPRSLFSILILLVTACTSCLASNNAEIGRHRTEIISAYSKAIPAFSAAAASNLRLPDGTLPIFVGEVINPGSQIYDYDAAVIDTFHFAKVEIVQPSQAASWMARHGNGAPRLGIGLYVEADANRNPQNLIWTPSPFHPTILGPSDNIPIDGGKLDPTWFSNMPGMLNTSPATPADRNEVERLVLQEAISRPLAGSYDTDTKTVYIGLNGDGPYKVVGNRLKQKETLEIPSAVLDKLHLPARCTLVRTLARQNALHAPKGPDGVVYSIANLRWIDANHAAVQCWFNDNAFSDSEEGEGGIDKYRLTKSNGQWKITGIDTEERVN